MGSFHLFTIAGISVSASPFYFLLLLMFAQGDWKRGLVFAVCITLSLLVHEFGHALVARHLRHQPSILLHGFGGLTSRTRTGRDVEEAAIIAMGPAAGLALGLVIYGLWWLLRVAGLGEFAFSQQAMSLLYMLLYPCITWNLLNLIPLWPLDGGQLFRLGLMRIAHPRTADRITHGLALALIGVFTLWALSSTNIFMLLVLLLLGVQNWQALKGQGGGPAVQQSSAQADALVSAAQRAFDQGDYMEAGRLSQQARALDSLSPQQLEKVWELLGLSAHALEADDEALSYLRRARPTEAVRRATEECLRALDRMDELDEFRARWQVNARAPRMHRWLIAALGFIAIAIGFVFSTPLAYYFPLSFL